ncbi:hypothetical protein AZE42_14147 [Rhizopogon vesiculosus]|uniref:Uncharacterized protein n=1 Tax=Rhizopogon vesiculosus TaxID=180088 RepID=A0A1J8QV47_9AGAM|nr:hypothetical protein AZE42_14147 [Rhizopogon vesiculosus]
MTTYFSSQSSPFFRMNPRASMHALHKRKLTC